MVTGFVEVVAATETESEPRDHDVIFRAPAPLTLPCPHLFEPRHRLSAVVASPVGLQAEYPWIRLPPLFADVLPLRPVAEAHAVMALVVGALLVCKVAMVHSNPLFLATRFLGRRLPEYTKLSKSQGSSPTKTKNQYF